MQNRMSTEEMKMVILENQKEEREKGQDKEVMEEQERERSIKVTARDRELVGHVALMRYAAERHLQRLVFGAPVLKANRKRKTGEPLAINVMRRRLQQVSSGRGALLRQVEYRDQEGAMRRAYCVTALGYNVARSMLKSAPPLPPGDTATDQHIAHMLELNDLYVELAATKKAAFVRAEYLPFAWRVESIQLPWKEFNERRGESEERRLVPDAILEIAPAKTRIFIESGMDSYGIVREPEDENDSVLAKLRRYAKFAYVIDGESHYTRQFADHWKPELLFLVNTTGRATSINTALANWRAEYPGHPLVVRAADLQGAAAMLAPRIGLPAPPPRKIEIAADDAVVLATTLQLTVALCKTVRHYLRAHPHVRDQGCPYPEYPAQLERALRLADVLLAQAAESCK